jgi:hypothetical protein
MENTVNKCEHCRSWARHVGSTPTAALITFLILTQTSFPQTNFWQQTNGPFYYGGFVLAVGIDSSGNAFAGTRTLGIYRSSDQGATWLLVTNQCIK